MSLTSYRAAPPRVGVCVGICAVINGTIRLGGPAATYSPVP